jgi:hypothetical protein
LFGHSTFNQIVAFRASGEKGKGDVEQHWAYGAMNPKQHYTGDFIGGSGFNLKPNHESVVSIKVYNRQYHVINALGAESVLSTYSKNTRHLKAKLDKLEDILDHYRGKFFLS